MACGGSSWVMVVQAGSSWVMVVQAGRSCWFTPAGAPLAYALLTVYSSWCTPGVCPADC